MLSQHEKITCTYWFPAWRTKQGREIPQILRSSKIGWRSLWEKVVSPTPLKTPWPAPFQACPPKSNSVIFLNLLVIFVISLGVLWIVYLFNNKSLTPNNNIYIYFLSKRNCFLYWVLSMNIVFSSQSGLSFVSILLSKDSSFYIPYKNLGNQEYLLVHQPSVQIPHISYTHTTHLPASNNTWKLKYLQNFSAKSQHQLSVQGHPVKFLSVIFLRAPRGNFSQSIKKISLATPILPILLYAHHISQDMICISLIPSKTRG